jgi:hypothetical protein
VAQTAEIIEHKSQQAMVPTASSPITPMEMIDRALQTGQSVEVMEKLMGLQERWEKNQARKAFDAAVSAAKAEMPVVQANREGHNRKRYADFAALARVVDPVIGRYGLAYRFRTVQDDRISVTCILSHRDGHYEETTLSGPADATGSKNAIQAIGSTLTYLQRYSLKQALGLAASDDDDAQTAALGEAVTDEQAADLEALIQEVGADRGKFLAYLKVSSLAEIPASQFKRACEALNAKRRQA